MCRRFTRLTNAFSKKMEIHAHAVALHFFAYNFRRPHQTLTKRWKRIKTTRAMVEGLTGSGLDDQGLTRADGPEKIGGLKVDRYPDGDLVPASF